MKILIFSVIFGLLAIIIGWNLVVATPYVGESICQDPESRGNGFDNYSLDEKIQPIDDCDPGEINKAIEDCDKIGNQCVKYMCVWDEVNRGIAKCCGANEVACKQLKFLQKWVAQKHCSNCDGLGFTFPINGEVK